ncbi:MAG: outer membrane channel [Deltaproteobacteria bacterium]|nr:outer membrane channel [Deltaproteobacteria bacterium]
MRKRAVLTFVFLLVAVPLYVPATPLAHELREAHESSGKGTPEEPSAVEKPANPLRFGPVKLGLDSLARAEATTHFSLGSFSFTPGNDESRILFRLRPSVTVTPSENVSARVEGQWYAFYDDKDFSLFSLYQGYVEGALPGVKGLSLKAGRQEFVYGSTFLLGSDTFYDGLTFDAARLSWKPTEKISLDLFGGQYVRKWAGDIGGKLFGIYAAYAPGKTHSVDLYGLRDTGGAGATHVGGEHEVTYSVGTRLIGKVGKSVTYELEPVYQFGRKNKDGTSHNDIRAYGGHADLTLDPALGRYPGKIFLSYAFGSGDGNPGEGKFTEFHNPDNDTSWIGDMSVIGDLSGLTVADPAGNAVHASGLHVITAGGGIDVTEKLNVSLDGHYFRAVKTPARISKEIGIETNLILTCKLKENVSVLVSGNRFLTGGFFKEAAGSGKDINYFYAQLQATF